jgi:UDP-glucose:(heptosyl)LPS alpha-1,3-glucosyltransferase
MKVALAFSGCNRRGGVERIIFESAKYLTNRGHEVTVFANEYEKDGATFTYRHVPVARVPGFLRPVSFFRQSQRMLNPADFDGYGSFGCVCPLGGVYWAQSVHAAWLEEAKKFRPPWSLARWKQRLNPAHPVLLRLEKLHFRRGNYRKIVALTADVQRDLERYYGVPSGDIVVIPNGFAPNEFNVAVARERRAAMRKELGYADDDRVIVFVANEAERKGLPALIRAMDAVNDPHWRLLAVGRLTPQPHPRVHYTGPTSEAAKYYAAADVFALPTQYEAWGLVIVEALACGLPVLTSRLAGAAVAVRVNETGQLLDDPNDDQEIAAKLRLLMDGNHASREEISASVAHYAWSEVLGQYEELLFSCPK